jgi:GTP-binding protein
MCALTGKGTKTLMKAIFAMEENWRARTSTSQLNRFLEAALATHQPPMVNGRRIKLKYLTQVKACPPTFVLFGNQTDSLPEAYRTYLLNGLREKLGFKGVPLRLLLRTPENPFRD